MVVAFLIRFIFAFGISAGSDFALSGGTSASSHAHIIENLLNGSFAFTDPALNYPYGSVVVYPIFMDVVLAGVAGIVSAFGISASTAAAGTLAFSAPIFAALTCWPVYLIGRKMFNDEKIGLLAALLYAFFALMIMTTAFSNGTEFAFVGFLFAFMIYYLLRALDENDKAQPGGFMEMLSNKALRKYTLIAAILFLLIILSWSQFHIILIMLVLFMAAQAIVDRIRSRSVMPTAVIYSTVILIGMLISLPYYLVAGLWDLIFSGPFIVAILSVGLVLIFAFTEKITWVLMIPILLIAAAAVLLALMFAAPDLFSAVMSGNSLYTNELMASLSAEITRTSVSSMAAFFGWVTVWLPLVMFGYMLYRYRKNMDSRKYTFIMLWLFAMFCIGWYSSSYAAVAGSAFAVASAAIILMVVRMTNLKGYFADMRGNGIQHAAKKALKPIQLATTIGIVALIIAPNLVYAADASTPSNSDGDGYFGGLGYTIMTDDLNSINKMWSDFDGVDKSGAIVTWLGFSTNAVSNGGFKSVADAYGGGASAMSAILLANSSAAATAAMAIRLMLSKNISDFQSIITTAGLDYNKIRAYIDNPSSAVEEVLDDVVTYAGISRSVTEENALYLVLTNYMTKTVSEPRINALYNSVRTQTGESITYVSADMSMLPLYFRDSSSFATAAFLGSYSIGGYGEPTQFYTYDTYTGYAMYTDAMYSTFFWKALIGMSPAEAGYSSAIAYLNALAMSDGTVKANPGYGMANYKIAYWHVYYNPDSKATGATPGWVDMSALGPDGAIALQASKGGIINFVNGVVVLEYDTSGTKEVTGTVNYVKGGVNAPANNIQVSVFVKSSSGSSSSGELGYVKRSTAFTDADGKYSILVPDSGSDYYVVFSSGASTIATGNIIETKWGPVTSPLNLNIPTTSFSGTVYIKNEPPAALVPYTQNCYVVMEGQASGKTYQANVNTTTGAFSFNYIIPDIYRVTLFAPSGTIINTGTVSVNAGATLGYLMSATSGTVNATVTTDLGAPAADGMVIAAKDTLTGVVYTGTTKDGKAAISVVPATYIVYAAGSKMSVSNPSVTVSSGGSSSAALVVYDVRNISVSGAPPGSMLSIMSYGFITSSTTSSTIAVPMSSGSTNESYTAYAVSGNNVYYGITTGTSVSLTTATGFNVTGTVKDTGGDPLSCTVSFIKQSAPHIGATFIFTSDADGKFNVRLPAGDYIMHIFGSSNASLTKVSITGDRDLGELTMKKSRDINVTLSFRTNMSPSTRGIAFVDILFTMTIGSDEFKVTVKTDAAGKATFTVPEGHAAKAESPSLSVTDPDLGTLGINTARFIMPYRSHDFTTTSSSTSWTLEADKGQSGAKTNGYVKVNGTVTASVSVTLTRSGGTDIGPGTVFHDVIPGQYTAETTGDTQYFKGTVYIFPGQTTLKIDTTNVALITLANVTDGKDHITVTPIDEEAGVFFEKGFGKYYLERGKSFYFTVESELNPGGGSEAYLPKIAYASVNSVSAPMTLTIADRVDKAVIRGFTGVNADGKLTMTYPGVSIPFDVSDGAFEITVPTGVAMTLTAKLSQTIGNTEFNYTGSASLLSSQVVDGASVRFHSTTSGTVNTLPEISGSGYNFRADGRGSFNLSIKNTGTTAATYSVTAGPAWVLDRTYTININPGTTATLLIEGRFDPLRVGAGNQDLYVRVATINGTTVGTFVLDANAFPASGFHVTTPGKAANTIIVDVRGGIGASADAVNGNEYMYAITITNNDNYLKSVSINATMRESHPNWSLVYAEKDGGMIEPAGTKQFNIDGFGSTVIYVKLMPKVILKGAPNDTYKVPSLDVNVTTTTAGQKFTSNTNSDDRPGGMMVIVDTNTGVKFQNLYAQSAQLEVQDTSASGTNIHSGSGIPALTLVLLALAILAFIAMIWLGMKKGVFVRKR